MLLAQLPQHFELQAGFRCEAGMAGLAGYRVIPSATAKFATNPKPGSRAQHTQGEFCFSVHF
jgi:hypothetical protein